MPNFEVFHREMEQLFAFHQEALVCGDLGLAGRYLALYRAALRLHIRQEDTLLLPRYGAFDSRYPWPARVYDGEHRKLERQLKRCVTRFADLCRDPSPGGLVGLLEAEKTLKHLSEHHHQREEESLFPALTEHLDSDELRELEQAFRSQWEHLNAARPDLLNRLRRRLGRSEWAGCAAATSGVLAE